MAIDSAAKRRSVASVSRIWRAPGITPDASPDQAWRQTAARGWYGILATASVPGATAFGIPVKECEYWPVHEVEYWRVHEIW